MGLRATAPFRSIVAPLLLRNDALVVIHTGADSMAFMIGKHAPNFELEAMHCGEFKQIRLADYRGRWLVVLFYPLDFTFVCPTELCAYSDRLDEFNDIGADVVGVSVDSKFTHLAWFRQQRMEGGVEGLRYPL